MHPSVSHSILLAILVAVTSWTAPNPQLPPIPIDTPSNTSDITNPDVQLVIRVHIPVNENTTTFTSFAQDLGADIWSSRLINRTTNAITNNRRMLYTPRVPRSEPERIARPAPMDPRVILNNQADESGTTVGLDKRSNPPPPVRRTRRRRRPHVPKIGRPLPFRITLPRNANPAAHLDIPHGRLLKRSHSPLQQQKACSSTYPELKDSNKEEPPKLVVNEVDLLVTRTQLDWLLLKYPSLSSSAGTINMTVLIADVSSAIQNTHRSVLWELPVQYFNASVLDESVPFLFDAPAAPGSRVTEQIAPLPESNSTLESVGSQADPAILGTESTPLLAPGSTSLGNDTATLPDSLIPDSISSSNQTSATPPSSRLTWTPVGRQYNVAGRYIPWLDLESYLRSMQAEYPSLITLGTSGMSHEGRPLYWVRLSAPRTSSELDLITAANLSNTVTVSGTQFNRTGRPAYLLTSGVHSREWISCALTLNLLDVWTAGYGHNPAITDLLRGFEVFLIPMANPDGYDFSFTSRLWRKTMEQTSVECVGVDINRNFPTDEWSDPLDLRSSSTDPCNEDFRGHSAGSSPETLGIISFVQEYQNQTRNRIQIFMDVHSYSQMWMFPSGYDCFVEYPELQDVFDASVVATDTILGVHETMYTAGDVCNVLQTPELYLSFCYTDGVSKYLHQVSGSSLDWMYQKANVRFSFAIELPDLGNGDEGQFGFLLPPESIVPTVEEMYAGIAASINYLSPKI